MAYIITNGICYICYGENQKIRKTKDIDEAITYESVDKAIIDMKRAPGKTAKYYVYNTETEEVCWKWLTKEQRERRKLAQIIQKAENKSHRRTNFTQDTRKMIYNRAEGRCQLCGKKILYNEMTVDHIVPLAMNGSNSDDNLQCACKSCNTQKAAYLPEEFIDGVTRIFLYQMEKKCAGKVRWKIIKGLMSGIM
jgi:5-methylcytosine-specific restriction endonuclease McrA